MTEFTAVAVSPAQPEQRVFQVSMMIHISVLSMKEEQGYVLARKVDGAKFPNPRLRAMC